MELDKIIQLPDGYQLIENRIYFGEFDGGDLIGLYTYFKENDELKAWVFYLRPFDPKPQVVDIYPLPIITALKNGNLILTNFRSADYGSTQNKTFCPTYLQVLGEFFVPSLQDAPTVPSIIMNDDKGEKVEFTRDSNSRFIVNENGRSNVSTMKRVFYRLFVPQSLTPLRYWDVQTDEWYNFHNPVTIDYDAIYLTKRDNEVESFGFIQYRDDLNIGEFYFRMFVLQTKNEFEWAREENTFAKDISSGFIERTWYKFNPKTVPDGGVPAIYQWLVSFFTDDFDPNKVPKAIVKFENDEYCLLERYQSESATEEVFCRFSPSPQSTNHPFYRDKADAIAFLLIGNRWKALDEYFDYASQQWVKTMYFGDDDTVETTQEEPPSEVQEPPQVVEFDKMEAMAKYLQNNTIRNEEVNMNDYARQIILNFISAVKSEHDDVSKKTQKVLKKYNNE